MTDGLLRAVEALNKAMEAGNYDAAPSTLNQGAARGVEDLSTTYYNTTFEEKHIKLQKEINVESCKSLLAQFVLQNGYGSFAGHAGLEGQLGREQNSDWNRRNYPMCYYSEFRQISLPATMVDTYDGSSNEETQSKDASKTVAGAVEMHLWRGMADFSNAGVFDANPLAQADMPHLRGTDVQVRQSDFQLQTKDFMFAAYGSDESVVINVGGVLKQTDLEDASTRSNIAFGDAKKLFLDPISKSNYNKLTLGKERVVLAGSPVDSTGASLKQQWVSSGTVELDETNFLRGRHKPDQQAQGKRGCPNAPSFTAAAAAGGAVPVGTHIYFVTAGNELEFPSLNSAAVSQASVAGDKITLTITPSGTGESALYFDAFRGASAATAKFIGRVKNSGAATTDFVDLGNKLPAFVTGFLMDMSTATVKELSPFTKMESQLAIAQLHKVTAFYRFLTLGIVVPRVNVILDNLSGTISGT